MSSRYYESLNSDGNEIKPGKISSELREALKIPDNDLPIWIYRMRALGYPPGWLKKAIVDTNDIFDTEDTNEDDQASGKRKNICTQGPVQYDLSKLIEYPGFNSPMPEGCIDYHYYVNMPGMLEHQQLEYAKKHMNSFTPVPPPKKIRFSGSSLNEDHEVITIDDDDDNGPGDPKSPNLEKSGPTELTCELDNKSTKGTNSTPAKDAEKGPIRLKNGLDSSKSEEIKLVSKGSPMPKPVQRAPLEKFSEGVVGELLYFENIASSTGKFESIRGLLNSIRKSKSENDTSFQSTRSEP